MSQLIYTQGIRHKGEQKKLKSRIIGGMWLIGILILTIVGLLVVNYYLTERVQSSESKLDEALEQYKEVIENYDIILQKYEEVKMEQEMNSQNFEQEKANLLQEQERLLKEIESLKEELQAKGDTKGQVKSTGKVAYLTFDDGPSENTKKILDTLKEHEVPATFFVTGAGLQQEDTKALYQRILDEGHQLGNHTYSHQYSYIYASKENFIKDFNRLEKEVFDLTNGKMVMVRFPGGSNTQQYRKYNKNGVNVMAEIKGELTQKGYVYVDWNVDSQDARTKELKSKKAIIEAVVQGASKQKTAVILMHDAPAKTTTAEALPEIIRQLKEKGYEFKALTPNSEIVQF